MTWRGDIATLPSLDRIIGVTIGAEMNQKLQRRLRRVLSERDDPIEIWRSDLHRSKYEVVFSRET